MKSALSFVWLPQIWTCVMTWAAYMSWSLSSHLCLVLVNLHMQYAFVFREILNWHTCRYLHPCINVRVQGTCSLWSFMSMLKMHSLLTEIFHSSLGLTWEFIRACRPGLSLNHRLPGIPELSPLTYLWSRQPSIVICQTSGLRFDRNPNFFFYHSYLHNFYQ